MGMTERRARLLAERRKRILASAQGLFRDTGYDAVTMQDIADASEISKGSLYLQFHNKEDIVLALVEDSFAHIERFLSAEAKGQGSACDRLQRIAAAYVEYASEESSAQDNLWLLARLAADPASAHQSHVRESIERLNSIVSCVFEDGKADGSIRPDLAAKDLVPLFTLVMTSFIERMSKIRRLVTPLIASSEEALIREFMEILLYYIRPRETRPERHRGAAPQSQGSNPRAESSA